MVRLLRHQLSSLRRKQVGFNPTMVRLLQVNASTIGKIEISFQSHNGAIAAWDADRLAHRILGFNPTMVRLLLAEACESDSNQIQFQSHNGAIAALIPTLQKTIAEWFQSHNGAIAAVGSEFAFLTTRKVSIPQWCDCCPS